ncbi:transposase-like protein [Colletotrichum musicola]|uniref:Transposase-like protein n=1 Tax=Colletotrichum musicola TaxID=2175873 RepID=A0A8H6MY08_9PEZI|nr:transposase-like protein [Colletotrichum musicola]
MTSDDVKDRRMRCYGHILNLTARAFLFGEDQETFEAESDFYQLVDRHEEDLRLWRKVGAVGRLRNIVKFIQASPQRSKRFRKASTEVDDHEGYQISTRSHSESRLILNNKTK